MEVFLRPGIGSPAMRALSDWVRAAPTEIDPDTEAIVRRWFPRSQKHGALMHSNRVMAESAGNSTRHVSTKNHCVGAAAWVSTQAWCASLCSHLMADVRFSGGQAVLQCVRRSLMTDATSLPCWKQCFPSAGHDGSDLRAGAVACLAASQQRSSLATVHHHTVEYTLFLHRRRTMDGFVRPRALQVARQ